MQIADLLTQLVTDTDVTMEVSSFAAVALGLTFVGTCHAASVEAMLQVSTHGHSCSPRQQKSAYSLITAAPTQRPCTTPPLKQGSHVLSASRRLSPPL